MTDACPHGDSGHWGGQVELRAQSFRVQHQGKITPKLESKPPAWSRQGLPPARRQDELSVGFCCLQQHYSPVLLHKQL